LKKVLTVLGARPQFIKAAAVSRVIRSRKPFREVILHTGQHYDYNMSGIFFEEMDIPRPDYHFGINQMGHGAMTGLMLQKIEEVLIAEKPDMVLVYGDTNSTLAGALSASKLRIRTAHVEAGLRSFNMAMPEEVNRILTDRISDLLYCPTSQAVANLEKEGFGHFHATIMQTGDVMYDAFLFYEKIANQRSGILKQLNLKDNDFVLCTVHRQENTDDPVRLKSIIAALNEIHGSTRIILPIHPRTRKKMEECGVQLAFDPVEPVGYLDMIQLLKHCSLVVTDSGGMQKEAYFSGKYCVTLRDQTEWTELVDQGFNFLSGSGTPDIVKECLRLAGKKIEEHRDLYGKGNASELIVESIQEHL